MIATEAISADLQDQAKVLIEATLAETKASASPKLIEASTYATLSPNICKS